MIRTESLTKYFGARCAVDGFDVEISPHQIVGFLGLNGAGKTTTLRMLSGLLAPSSGRVLVEDEDLSGPQGHRARARIGFLPDRPPVYEEMTVSGYLTFAARLRGHPGGSSRIAEVLSRTGLETYASDPISQLSHGYRQRVGIAQAIVHDPALVILDEPMSGLDPRQVVEMRQVVRSLGADHTVLLSSHNLTEVGETCDQLLLIDEGRLVAQGSPGELTARLGGTGRLAVTVVGERSAVDAVMTQLEATQAEILDPGLGAFEVELESARPAEEVARAFFEAGLGVRRLQPATSPLEGLFAELTKEEAA
ncbi:MAG: ABC transporter ATP-binding protein [Myxococcota bacterium]